MDIRSLFWVVLIIIWIISALTRKQAEKSRGEPPEGEEGSRKPEEAIERFLRRLAGDEEEIKVTPPPFQPIVEELPFPPEPIMERVAPPPAPQPREEQALPPKAEEPLYKVELPERKKEIKRPLLGSLNTEIIRQGIILSEILGPPRGEKPF